MSKQDTFDDVLETKVDDPRPHCEYAVRVPFLKILYQCTLIKFDGCSPTIAEDPNRSNHCVNRKNRGCERFP